MPTRLAIAELHEAGGDEADQRPVRDPPHPEPLDHPAVDEGGERHAERHAAEDRREPGAEAVDVDEDLLRRVDVAHQRAEDRAGRQRVAERQPVGRRRRVGARHPAGRHRPTASASRVSGSRIAEPGERGDRGGGEEGEDQVPAADQQEGAADARRQHRHDDEDHHHEGHDLGHAPPAVDVAHHRDGDHPRRGVGDALQHAGGQQVLEAAGEQAADRGERVDREPDEQHRLAPEPVRQRSVRQLADGEADDVAGHHELHPVRVGQPELVADHRQRRQHDVDRQRGQRHQQRHHRDELGEARRRPRRGGGVDRGHGGLLTVLGRHQIGVGARATSPASDFPAASDRRRAERRARSRSRASVAAAAASRSASRAR